jgi:hypothetical protein
VRAVAGQIGNARVDDGQPSNGMIIWKFLGLGSAIWEVVVPIGDERMIERERERGTLVEEGIEYWKDNVLGEACVPM